MVPLYILRLPPAKSTPTDFKGTAHTIFLIDDDDDWARFVFQTLLSAGKSITRQNTLSGAKSADLILVDQALTAEPVIGVLQQIQEMGLAPKTILVSAALKVEGVRP
jgi:response regulator of citrate/malate metabolism